MEDGDLRLGQEGSRRLREDGFVVVPALLAASELEPVVRRLEQVVRAEVVALRKAVEQAVASGHFDGIPIGRTGPRTAGGGR